MTGPRSPGAEHPQRGTTAAGCDSRAAAVSGAGADAPAPAARAM